MGDKVNQYLSQYKGLGQVLRAHHIIKIQKEQLGAAVGVVINSQLDFCKKNGFPGQCKKLIEDATTLKVKINKGDIAQWQVSFQKDIDNKCSIQDQEANALKKSNKNDDVRFKYYQLGNSWLDAGEAYDAYRVFEKALPFEPSNSELLSQLDRIVLAAFWDKKYDVVQNLVQRDYIPDTKKARVNFAYVNMLYAISKLIERNTIGFLGVFKSDNFDIESFSDFTEFTSIHDLAGYICLSLLTLSRREALTYIKNQNFSELFKMVPNASKLIEAYLSLNYPVMIDQYRYFLDSFKWDPFLVQNKLSDLKNLIDTKLIKQFASPYQQVAIGKISEQLKMDKNVLTAQLVHLIQNDQLDFLIDPIEDSLIKKSNAKTKETETYLNSIKAIDSYLQDKQLSLLRYQLNNIHSEKLIKQTNLPQGIGMMVDEDFD